MGTRSCIAVKNKDGSYDAIYSHWDGYPSGVGATLLHHYSDPATVAKLIALGDISVLRERVEPKKGEKHSFDAPLDDVTIAYHRDRGEPRDRTRAIRLHSLLSLNAHAKEIGAEWLYVFQDGAWHYAKGGVSAFGMPASKEPGPLCPLTKKAVKE